MFFGEESSETILMISTFKDTFKMFLSKLHINKQVIIILSERPNSSSEQSVTSLTRELWRGLTGILGSKRGKTMLPSQYIYMTTKTQK